MTRAAWAAVAAVRSLGRVAAAAQVLPLSGLAAGEALLNHLFFSAAWQMDCKGWAHLRRQCMCGGLVAHCCPCQKA